MDLCEADLGDSDLESADLHGAKLERSQLERADLTKANCRGTRLREANLFEAELGAVDLGLADLGGANLSKARLGHANLRMANLAGANFDQVHIEGTTFSDVDLSESLRLENVTHDGPSHISVDTIYKSRGKIPEVFLRGCGLQDWEIELVKLYRTDASASDVTSTLYRVAELRASQGIHYHSCFISHSTQDQEFADRLYADLQAKGVRCWFAPHDIKGGRKIHEQLDEAIRLHDKLLLILSPSSMSSNWVQTEIANAREREEREKKQLLFPITLAPFEDVKKWKLPDGDTGLDSARVVREYFIPDFSNWKNHDSYQSAFNRLVRDLKAEPAARVVQTRSEVEYAAEFWPVCSTGVMARRVS